MAALVNLIGANLDIAIIGSAAGLITAGAMWWTLLQEHRDLLWEIETRIGADLDKDGQIGRPPSTTLQITIPATEQHGKQIMILNDLEATPQQLRIWAAGMLAGRMAENDWCVGKSRLFQRPQFKRLRQQFIDRKLMVWKDEDAHWQGTELTSVGRRMCQILKDRKVDEQE